MLPHTGFVVQLFWGENIVQNPLNLAFFFFLFWICLRNWIIVDFGLRDKSNYLEILVQNVRPTDVQTQMTSERAWMFFSASSCGFA